MNLATLDDREAWLYGIDLFNARYYWEAHEAWERLWLKAAPGSPGRDIVKGLIQISAGLLKLSMNNELAARRLAKRGAGLIQAEAESCPMFRGLRLELVVHAARSRIVDAPNLTLESGAFVLAVKT